MATEHERLSVLIEANTKSYENAMKRLEQKTQKALNASAKSTQSLNKAFNTLGITMSGIGKGLAIGAFTAAVGSLGAMAGSAIKDAAAIGDLADKLGISTFEMQALQLGAVKANMSLEELGKGLLKFSKGIGDATRGEGELYDILVANNVAIPDAAGKQLPLNDLLERYADLIRNARSEQEAMVLVTAGFGRGSDEMLEFLRKGSEGLREFKDELRASGNAIEDHLVRGMQVIDDRWAALMLSMKRETQGWVLETISAFNQIINSAIRLPLPPKQRLDRPTHSKRFQVNPMALQMGVEAFRKWDADKEDPEALVAAILYSAESYLIYE